MLSQFAIALVRFYQWIISPLLGPCCRYQPSCSEYAIAAIRKHGAIHGGYLTLRRVLRCHPWGNSGFDPVPDTISEEIKV